MVAEGLAHARLAEVEQLQRHLVATQEVKAAAEKLALERYDEIKALSDQLNQTEQAKSIAERLAHDRLAEVNTVQKKLVLTGHAKAEAELLAFSRYEQTLELGTELEKLSSMLGDVQIELSSYKTRLDIIQKSLGYKVLCAMRLIRKEEV